MHFKRLWLVGALLLAPLSFADALSTLNVFNQKVSRLSGDFTQTVKNKQGIQKGSGYFSISRPRFFHWEYKTPYRQLIIGDGQYVWMYDVDLKQVIKKGQDAALGQSPAAILADKNMLSKAYIVKNDLTRDGVEYVLAIPKRENTGYQFVRLGFKNGILSRMELKDSFGNLSLLSFSHLTENAVPKNSYRFIPPKEVDVLTE
ncbi:MAG: outer membrane lipoprotein carrier protein LolA [Haemophilus parainfluenzae]|nr:MAG: outer membrane lipoprotein carrier protein LolA [Haemophilus parainfluenzae]